MATRDEIEAALACERCCDVAEAHLRDCEPDDCGVVGAYRRVLARVEAGEHDDWRAPGRAAMTAMMAAEAWMHESQDHRVVHLDIDDTLDRRPLSAPGREPVTGWPASKRAARHRRGPRRRWRWISPTRRCGGRSTGPRGWWSCTRC